MRFYGFDVGELTTSTQPDLSFDIDPKLAWALRHRDQFPVHLQKAPRELLLRVPGLGVRNADLRFPGEAARAQAYAQFVDDLRKASQLR